MSVFIRPRHTLYIEFRQAEIVETKDFDENTLFDMDAFGNVCGITVEHAKSRAEMPAFSYEEIAA